MTLNTHLKLDSDINGKVVELKDGYAKVEQITKEFMVADEQGLVHGGFAFCAADFAAMVAVNDPNVVLGKSEVKFLAPVKLGDTVIFEGNISAKDGAKATVDVVGCVGDKEVFKGSFTTFTLDKHILS
jgi:acyl-coenzyme A thioesterase PaaI-like protein